MWFTGKGNGFIVEALKESRVLLVCKGNFGCSINRGTLFLPRRIGRSYG
jgi:hypothetical protein